MHDPQGTGLGGKNRRSLNLISADRPEPPHSLPSERSCLAPNTRIRSSLPPGIVRGFSGVAIAQPRSSRAAMSATLCVATSCVALILSSNRRFCSYLFLGQPAFLAAFMQRPLSMSACADLLASLMFFPPSECTETPNSARCLIRKRSQPAHRLAAQWPRQSRVARARLRRRPCTPTCRAAPCVGTCDAVADAPGPRWQRCAGPDLAVA